MAPSEEPSNSASEQPVFVSVILEKSERKNPICISGDWLALRIFWYEPISGIELGRTYDAEVRSIDDHAINYKTVVLSGQMDTTFQSGEYYLALWVPKFYASEAIKLELLVTPRGESIRMRDFEKQAPKDYSR